jgi:hypothetical protein
MKRLTAPPMTPRMAIIIASYKKPRIVMGGKLRATAIALAFSLSYFERPLVRRPYV